MVQVQPTPSVSKKAQGWDLRAEMEVGFDADVHCH
jgi:hypothetical protein